MTIPIKKFALSFGIWCLLNKGGDPFGDAVRKLLLEQVLPLLADVEGVDYFSVHDDDVCGFDQPQDERLGVAREIASKANELMLTPLNSTTNLFYDATFRSGAFTSPFASVREAALVKFLYGLDFASELGARHVILWDGRGGTDGAYEMVPYKPIGLYCDYIKVGLAYSEAKGYQLIFTLEPKQYEPRFKSLHVSSGGVAAAAIMRHFPGPEYAGKILVNPEIPQHVGMLCGDPVAEIGLLLDLEMLAPFIHFGGQIPGRMDCDFPPGMGSSLYDDFMVCLTLTLSGWDGAIEFDCRPLRTTTTLEGMQKFVQWSVNYWRHLEKLVEVCLNHPIHRSLMEALGQSDTPAVSALMDLGPKRGQDLLSSVDTLRAGFPGYQPAREANTDLIEELWRFRLGVCNGTIR